MRVSQRLDYALRLLVFLAAQPPGGYVAVGDHAERMGLPRRFAEQQISALARAGVVRCRRGAAGGCTLARPADSITVREVVAALEGVVLDVPRQPGSSTAEAWAATADVLAAHLDRVTLGALAHRQRELDATASPMYFI
jgi:Rrf2 family protein